MTKSSIQNSRLNEAQLLPATPASAISSQNAARLACLAMFAAAPIFALATWQINYTPTLTRHFSLPILAAELIVICLALASGADLRAFVSKMTIPSKIATAVFAAAAIAAALGAQAEPRMAKVLMFSTLLHMLFLGFCCERFSSDWKDMRHAALLSVSAGAAVYFIIVFGLALSVPSNADFNWSQFGAGVSNVRQIGYYGLGAAGIAAGFLAYARNGRETCIALVLLTLGASCIFWSGGRASTGGFVIAMIFVAILLRKHRLARYAAGLLVSLITAALISITFIPGPQWGISWLLGRIFHGATGAEYTSGRMAMWFDAVKAISEKPLIGHGQGQYRFVVETAGGMLNHPHNALLQFLFDWGLTGTLALCVFAIAIGRNAIFAARVNSALAMPAIGAMMSLVAMSMLDGALYYPYPIVVVLIACAVLLSIRFERTCDV